MSAHHEKPRIGITVGDYNGIGAEVILKTYADSRVFEFGTPIIYASPKIINFYKHQLKLDKLQHQVLKNKDLKNLSAKALNIVNCLDDNFEVEPGKETELAGQSALALIDEAIEDLKSGYIDVLVTGPINKNTIKIPDGVFTGHTEYITRKFDGKDSLMLLVSDTLRMGLVTNHLPVKDIAANVTVGKILDKLKMMHHALVQDFAISSPRIAVLSLNPHAGDNGLIGKEEKEIIAPAVQKAQDAKILAYGPYPADGFMGAGHYKKFDAVLAMYHDQGLVAFKSVAFGGGVNFTAGISIIRTSPDHGTAYDLAGKDQADESSMREAIFAAVDIHHNRKEYAIYTANPLVVKERKSESRE